MARGDMRRIPDKVYLSAAERGAGSTPQRLVQPALLLDEIGAVLFARTRGGD